MRTPTTTEAGLMKACGFCLLVGSLLVIAGFVTHPEEAPTADGYRAIVAANADAARLSHDLILFGLVGLAGAGVFGALSELRRGSGALAVAGPLIVALGSLIALPVVAVEGTVLPDAAVAGDVATFNTWYGFGSAFLVGFPVLALGFAATAYAEARKQAGAMRVVAYVASGLAVVAVVGCVGAFYVGIWAFNVLSYALLGVLLWAAIGAGMELVHPGGHEMPAPHPSG